MPEVLETTGRAMAIRNAKALFALARQREAAGDFGTVEHLYRRLTALLPGRSALHNNLGVVLQRLGRPAEAEPEFRRAVGLAPDAGNIANLAGALVRLGRWPEAIALCRTALGRPLEAGSAALAAMLAQLENFDAGMERMLKTLPVPADSADAFALLGHALYKRGRPAEAAAAYQQALIRNPHAIRNLNNLGVALMDLDRLVEAETAFRAAIAADPAFVAPYNNLGNALMLRERFEPAAAMLGQALAVAPDYVLGHLNRGDAFWALHRFADALASYERAVAVAPDDAEGHQRRALLLLLLGRYAEGWAEYEWRDRAWRRRNRRLDLAAPRWAGEDLAGKRILLHTEQGRGDGIQFARFATDVAARGGHVVLLTHASLRRLLATVPGVAEIRTDLAGLEPVDYQLSVMSVPHVVGMTLATVPAAMPYVRPPVVATEAWRERLAAVDGLKVGLVWAGDPRRHDLDAHRMDRRRSIPLARFAALGDIPGITLFSLQRGPGAAELATAPERLVLHDHMDEMRDFADTAALVANLDLVIAVDTSVAHLAGALGKPVWILSRHDGCWRWLLDRDDSPWYPTARLYRQARRGDWDPVIARVAADLAGLARGHTP